MLMERRLRNPPQHLIYNGFNFRIKIINRPRRIKIILQNSKCFFQIKPNQTSSRFAINIVRLDSGLKNPPYLNTLRKEFRQPRSEEHKAYAAIIRMWHKYHVNLPSG